ncbi:four helix bundle protein [Candidatus Nomurabacteria bacterium]|nr:four helix bundle protein [Candidatus Nomurabacteria bacterium]
MSKIYDLEERTRGFALSVRDLIHNLEKTQANLEYSRQLIRSSASIGANYIEANESLGKKDFLMRLRISRKEAKESSYWLSLLEIGPHLEDKVSNLKKESIELMNIMASIIRKCQ